MSRKRALKKRADFRKGGFVDRQKFQSGGTIVDYVLKDGKLVHRTTGQPFNIGDYAQSQTGSTTPATSTTSTTPTTTTTAPTVSGDPVSVGGSSSASTSTTTPSTSVTNGQANGGTIDTGQATTVSAQRKFDSGAAAPTVRTDFIDETIAADPSKSRMEDRQATAAPEDATANVITAAQGETAQATQQAPVQAAQMTAVQAGDVAPTEAAQGQVTQTAQAEGPELSERAVAAERDTAQEQAALAQTQELEVGQDAFVQRVVGEQADVVQTTPAEKQQREAVLGMPAPSGEEAQIINEFGFGASKNRVLRGEDAKQAAAGRLVAEHGLSQDVADSILEDVGELVTNIDGIPQESLGAVASLPKEALVSSQMEALLAGMEDGKTPAFARPAVAAVEQMLADRGLSASSVGRDALFNAIIQSALPIAQSNAQALQQRASQNLSNEQQALIQDRQIASDFLGKNAAFKQQMEIANLSNDQQMRLANLTAQNQAGSENLSAAQQTELAELNSRMQTNLLQAKLAQEMGVAQLSVDQQTAMNNAALNANIDFTKFNTAQQTELANSKFMQSMTMADFNANQQTAIQNATALASMDLAAADQRTKLAITNAQNFLQMDMANLTNEQQAFMLDQQLLQQRLLSDQAAQNAASQFNATSENQMNQFMTNLAQGIEIFNNTQLNAMSQFNTSEENRTAALNAQNDLEADKFNSQMQTQVELFDQELEFKADQWNAQNEQVIEQSNVEWRRKSNTLNTAAQNESNRMAAQMTFNMSMGEQNFLWQQMRDEASFSQQALESEKERAMQIMASIFGNTELMDDTKGRTKAEQMAAELEKIVFGRYI
jgi:hypothetical protein